MSYIQIQQGGKANSKDAKYVNLAWNEWDPGRKRPAQRRVPPGRLAPGGRDVLVNKRRAGRSDLHVPLSEVDAHAQSRFDFEAWLRTRSGAGPGSPKKRGLDEKPAGLVVEARSGARGRGRGCPARTRGS